MLEKYRHPVRFYVLCALIPWGFWLMAAYLSHRPQAPNYGLYISGLGFLGLCSPALVAGHYIRKSRTLRTDVLERLWQVGCGNGKYAALSVVLMPASIVMAMAVSLLFGYGSEQFVISGHATFSSTVFPVWFLLVVAPVLEELAWHSYGTDCLRQRYSLFTTSMVFAAYWTVWHVPLALIDGYYHSNLVVEGARYGMNFMASIFPFVLLMNWLYYKTNRNILVAVAMHLGANVFNEIFATHPDSKIIQTVLLSLLAILVLARERSFFFTRPIAYSNSKA